MARQNRGGRRGNNSSRSSQPNSGTRASGVADTFTRIDELLAEQNDILRELNTSVSRTGAGTVSDPTDTTTRGGSLPPRDAPPVFSYDFSSLVAADTFATDPDTVEFVVPQNGTIRRALLGWPLGTQQAVGIGVLGPDKESLIPRGPADAEFLAYDNEVLSFGLNVDVEKDDKLTIKRVNNDNEQHFVNVTLFFQENAD